MQELTGTRRSNFITDLDLGYAVEVKGASFRQGEDDEIVTRFYRLWGRVIRSVENRSTTSTRFYFVNRAVDLEIFNSYHGLREAK